MSTATELNRIIQAKADLKTAIEAKGVTVPSATTIDGYATLVGQISGGGGGGSQDMIDLIERDITSIDLSNTGITSIGSYSFYGCSGLTSFTIPSSVTNISDSAFRGSGLTSITIPSSVTNIGNRCFQDCSNLSSVTVEAVNPPTLGRASAFANNASGRKIYVPAESVNAYQTELNWSTYAADIEAIPSA